MKTVAVTGNDLFSFQQMKALNNPCFLNEHLKFLDEPKATQKSHQIKQTCRIFFFFQKGVFSSSKLALVGLIPACLKFINSSEDIGAVFLLENQWDICF